LLKKAANIQRGAGNQLKEKVGTITKAQLKEIAQTKMRDLNAYDIDAAMNIIAGTARNMGITVKE
jgi:large subunit ribosomal protein L11